MKLKIQDFASGQTTDKFNFKLDAIEGLDYAKTVLVNGSITKINDVSVGEIFIVSGSYSGEIKVECVRCLKEITQNIDGEFNWRFLDPKSYRIHLKSLKEENEVNPDEAFEEAIDGEIDIADLIRQQIILDMEPYPSCENFCDDDSEIKKYSDDGIDHRWAKLLEL